MDAFTEESDPRRAGRASVNRRTFIKLAGAATVLGTATETRATAHEADAGAMAVLVDLTKCNGCRQCEAACQKANGLEFPDEQALSDKSVFERRRYPEPRQLTTVNRFDPPGIDRPVYAKVNCLHCVDPACVSACLVGAMRKEPGGPVTYDPSKCMGCRYCMVACPFEIPTYEYDHVLTPQVRKCTFCVGANAPLSPSVPACVKACPKECLLYGRRSELLKRAHERIAQHPDEYVDHVYGEHEAGGTSWLYLSPVPFEQVGFLNVPPTAPSRLSEAIQHGIFARFVPPLAWCAVLALTMRLTRPVTDDEAPTAPGPGNGRMTPTTRSADGGTEGSLIRHATRPNSCTV